MNAAKLTQCSRVHARPLTHHTTYTPRCWRYAYISPCQPYHSVTSFKFTNQLSDKTYGDLRLAKSLRLPTCIKRVLLHDRLPLRLKTDARSSITLWGSSSERSRCTGPWMCLGHRSRRNRHHAYNQNRSFQGLRKDLWTPEPRRAAMKACRTKRRNGEIWKRGGREWLGNLAAPECSAVDNLGVMVLCPLQQAVHCFLRPSSADDCFQIR